MTSRIAVLSDIHANPFALEAVIEDIASQRVGEVLVAGDMVGRGPLGSQVVARIRELGWSGVRGNHEDYTLNFRRKTVKKSWLSAPEWAASRWMAGELHPDHVEFLDALPFSRTPLSAPSMRVFHGSPDSYCEGLGDWTKTETIQKHFNAIEESLLVCAHTHRPMAREIDGGLVVNIGSVGLPFNGDPRAQYAIFSDTPAGWQVEFRQVDYDREAFLRTYDTTGFREAGGITVELLKREIQSARPFLVPYIKWAAATNSPPVMDSLMAFLEIYRPEMSMRKFLKILAS